MTAQQVVEDVLTSKRKYRDLMSDLTSKMDSAKIPTEQQKTILGELRQKFIESGGSIKDFKAAVKECGDDVLELTRRINGIPEKKEITIIPGMPSNISLDVATGGKKKKKKKTKKNAAGGYVSGGPQLSWLAPARK